jgi:hypothetical protein
MNDVGANARLLSAKIGRNPSAEADEDATLWETLGELNHEFQIIQRANDSFLLVLKESNKHMKKRRDINQMDLNITKMYNHYKDHLGWSKLRMIEVECQVSVLSTKWVLMTSIVLQQQIKAWLLPQIIC